MLKFLTHKLRTHSLNEEIVTEKAEERDSGTESDDEAEHTVTHEDVNSDDIMKWNEATDISMSEECCACAPRLLPAPDGDHLYDHHSSEEELEVINGEVSASGVGQHVGESRRRGASSPPPAAPGKRKWQSGGGHYDAQRTTHSDDDDDDHKIETPVRFRTSPPRSLLRPRRVLPATGRRNASPTHSHAAAAAAAAAQHECERRARRRHRPQLDFDKMQQLKVGGGGVTSWRQVGGSGGELSVFCW